MNIGLLLISNREKQTFGKIFLLGASSLLIYFVILHLLGLNLLFPTNTENVVRIDKALIFRLLILFSYLVLHFNFLSLILIKGWHYLWKQNRKLFIGYVLALTPQFILIVMSSNFLGEMGSFLLMIFWIVAMPFGLGITAERKLKSNCCIIPGLAATFLITVFIWIIPNQKTAIERNAAAFWLKGNKQQEIKIIGHWDGGISAAVAKYGYNINKLSNYFFDKSYPNLADLQSTKENSLIIVKTKKGKIYNKFGEYSFTGIRADDYNPIVVVNDGMVEKLYENDEVILFEWSKKQ